MTSDQTTSACDEPSANEILVVDLDGTLIRSDLLWEAFIRLALRARPGWLFFQLPSWLWAGPARLKAALAQRITPDPEGLPYRRAVLGEIHEARANGRQVLLASASPTPWVEAVSAHLGCIDRTLGSSPTRNLKGVEKLRAIREEIGESPFTYIGNSKADIPIWAEARTAITVAPGASRRARAGRGITMQELDTEDRSSWLSLLRELRPHQWAKNALLFAPVLLAHQLGDREKLLASLLAFALFSAVASAGYILNDLVDIDEDRADPAKRKRPLAAGTLPIPVAVFAGISLFLGALLSSILWASPALTGMLVLYVAITLVYSLYLKQILLLDVLILAGLYTHRLLSGGIAADVPISPWLLVFSAFLFLSLAFVKRFIELGGATAQPADAGSRGRAYRNSDAQLIEGMGLACAFISVLVLCLFVSSPDVSRLYTSPALLWLMCPIMLYWIGRIWFLAHRNELDADPVLFATRDLNSYVASGLILLVVAAAAKL